MSGVSRSRLRLGLIAAVATIYLSGCAALQPKPAPQKKRIVILKLRGPKSKMVRNELVKVLEQRYHLVPQALYREMAKKLRARSMRPKHVEKVAAELNLYAIIDGRVMRRKGKKLALRLNVRSGADGTISEKIKLQTPRVFDEPARTKIDRELVAAIDGLPPTMTMEPEDEGGEDLAQDNSEDREKAAKERAAKAGKDKAVRDKAAKEKAAKDRAAKSKTTKADKHKGKHKGKSDAELDPDWKPPEADGGGQVVDDEAPPPPP